MKTLPYYKSVEINPVSNETVFNYLLKTFISSHRSWSYYVDWKKVKANIEKYKLELGLLNTLCSSKNFDKDLTDLVRKYPEVKKVFPTLLGIRGNTIEVLYNEKSTVFDLQIFDFGDLSITDRDMDSIVTFFEKSGLKKLISEGGISNIQDFAFGVEVGLDTNGRKNRGGRIMEDIVERMLKKIYHLKPNELISQATPSLVKKTWDIEMPVDKTSRRPDFVVKKNNQLYWIETNFFGGGGSKLKSTCGEYQGLERFCTKNGIKLIWVTDGKGWETTKAPLREAFDNNNYIFNLEMVRNKILEQVWV